MKSPLFIAILLTTLISSASCSDGESNQKSTLLTQSDIEEYSVTVTEMFKTSMMTMTITEEDCVMHSKDLKVDLTENRNQKIELKKNFISTSTKECLSKKLDSDNQVEVSPFEDDSNSCKYTGTRSGDILEIKSTCDDEISIVDLTAKTLRSTSPTTEVFVQAVTVEREELLGYLENIKIVHYKKNSNNTVSVGKIVTGNANTILNLGL